MQSGPYCVCLPLWCKSDWSPLLLSSGFSVMSLIQQLALYFQNKSNRSWRWPFSYRLMICIFHLLFIYFLFFLSLCDMESRCVIHIQILFKSAAPHLHVKLRIWSQVACILIRGTTFIGVRVDIANKWDRVLIIVMKGVFYIVHRHKSVFFLACNESDILLNPFCFQLRNWLILSPSRETPPQCPFTGQNYPQDGGLSTHQKPFILKTKTKKKQREK